MYRMKLTIALLAGALYACEVDPVGEADGGGAGGVGGGGVDVGGAGGAGGMLPGEDGAVPDPDDGVPAPDEGTPPDPDDGVPDPDEGAPDPDDGVPDPDEGAPDPDDGVPDPDLGPPGPQACNSDPNAIVAAGPCGPGQVCDFPPGRCDAADLEGVCLDRPEACPRILDPVCGCNGETYPNDCERLRAGVARDHRGECPPVDGCADHGDCPRGAICEFEADTCDDAERRGECVGRPRDCPPDRAPVCGCDGVTYANDCQRQAAGAAASHDGACEVEPDLCRENADCAEGDYCACQGACGAPGQCRERPQFCHRIYDPVCGCDGNTYGNACTLAAAGGCLAHDGECEQQPDVCGGIAGIPCDRGEVCDLPAGECNSADLQGLCVERPDACLRIYQPVCGCDGETYGNDCERIRAGVQKEHDGECREAGCERDGDCQRRDFCEFDAGSCGAPEGGACELVPELCARIYQPVCGCDGETYGNDCERRAARISKAHDGPCRDLPRRCADAEDCDDGELCECNAGCGSGGVCRARPEACPDNLEPVCGCDGETYGNDCERLAAGTCLAHRGECREAPCGVRGGAPCDEGQVCELPAGRCEVADLPGACVERPDACPRVYDPVCGCDGVTYPNDCLRLRAGAAKDHDGVCEQEGCEGPDDCDDGELCECARGCGVAGECAPRPRICPDVLDPVCGCDGETYGNDCERQRAGTCLAHAGRCEQEGACQDNGDCPRGQMCELERGACGGDGRCVERPARCILVYQPVCGCDGETYGNDCIRRGAGVAFDHDGPCEAPPEACRGNDDCGDGGFCECRGACGAPGVCGERPARCPAELDPVCGCSGRTHTNDCFRQRFGDCLAHDGPCELAGVCGGIAGIACPDGEVCELPAGMCNGADLQGRCVPEPEACPRIWDPVCGCDGRTYANDCVRVATGVAKDHDGECEQDGCQDNGDCGERELCAKAPGDCDGAGECRPRPARCILVFDPVCGCDGETYGNACVAAAAGANVAHDGPCREPPNECADNGDCARGEFCACAEACGGGGECQRRPLGCPDVFDPVCGCNGTTYGNDCEREAAGVCLEHDGPCRDGQRDCADNGDCARGQFCECAGACGSEGVCEPRPEACIRIFDPVCGCDGNTYANDCLRERAGTCLVDEGPCEIEPPACEGDGDCEDGQYCASADCGEPGLCQARPDACPEVFDPVCGCDGTTYANACFAAAAGANVAHEGACPPPRCEDNGDCARGAYCACGEAQCGAGVCQIRPRACPDVFDPVCGCDGENHGNACEAAAAGVCVEHEGECEDEPAACADNGDCARGEYCSKDVAACGDDGLCRPRPGVCANVRAPVCGCDGETYENACVAAAAGVSVAARGECRPQQCRGARDCGAGQYCECSGACGEGGECADRPQLCLRIYRPVCGCDGNTHANDCERRRAGVCLEHEGECEAPPRECADNRGCEDGEFCAKEVAACGEPGVCLPRPDVCPDVFDPVCGCGGDTHGNACEAAAAGDSIAHRGACEQAACRDNRQCGRDEYCAKPPASCAAEGECRERPQICGRIFAPVCGCDGNTYGNACLAANAGANVVHDGACEVAACQENDDCEGGYCAKPEGECEGDGECRALPRCNDEVAPVCGCDGNTYGNPCLAATRGVSVAHQGRCQQACRDNEGCPDGQFCARPAGECGAGGVCAPRPEACIAIFDPVCGCDGNTYGNACTAAQRGVPVAHGGECEAPPPVCSERQPCPNRRQHCECAAGQCGGAGICLARPDVCAEIFRPVCGCDGMTYGNDCFRQAAAVCLLHQGACVEDNRCETSRDCDAGQLCECEGNLCGAGVCADRPQICPRDYNPVCGCDNRTYGNDCSRRAAGMCLRHGGECRVIER